MAIYLTSKQIEKLKDDPKVKFEYAVSGSASWTGEGTWSEILRISRETHKPVITKSEPYALDRIIIQGLADESMEYLFGLFPKAS